MRKKFSRFYRRLRGGADPDDDLSDDDTYDDKPIVIPKHKRGREMKSSILSRKAVEAVRQMSLSTKNYDPLNTHSDRASVVEEYHKGYSNDQMYLVPDSTLRTMKNIVNYQLRKPPTTYYVGAKNLDTLPQLTVFDNIKMSLDSVMHKIDELGDDDDELSDLTTTTGSSTSDSSAISVPEYDHKEVKEESKPSQQTEEQNKNVEPESVKSEIETVEQIAESNMPESPSSESSDSGELSSESETVEVNKELHNEQEQVLKRALVPGNLIQQTASTGDTDRQITDTDYLKAETGNPEAQSNIAKVDVDHMKVDTDLVKADTGHTRTDTDHVKTDMDHKKPVTDHSKRSHQKQYFILEGKFENNLKPVFAIKKCKLTNEVISDRLAHGLNHKKLIFTKKHSKKVYVDIEGQFEHKEMPDKGNEIMHENRTDNIDSINDCEFAINVQRLCNDNSEIKINITGHLVRQENAVRYIPVLVLKLRNKNSKINYETQLLRKEDNVDMSVSNQPKAQLNQQNKNVDKPLSPRDEIIQRPPINYQTKPRLTNEDDGNANQNSDLFQYRPLMNYQAMPILINGPGTHINKQEANPRKEIGQGIVNNQIVPVLTGDHMTKQRERITYRAVNSQVMPVFQMPVFQIPVIECMHIPQNQCYSVIPLQRRVENASHYLNPRVTEIAQSRIITPNAFNTVMQDNDVASDLNSHLSKVQYNSSVEADNLLFPNTETPKGRDVEHTTAERETVHSNSDENVNKKMLTPEKKLKKSKQIKKTASSDRTRPMDTGGAGNKINIVNNPIVGQLEEFFIGHVHIPQTYLQSDKFELSHLKQKKISVDDIIKIKNSAGYLLRLNLQQMTSDSYSGETTLFEKAILKTQIDVEHFFLNTETVESLILLPQIMNRCEIHYTEMHLKTCFNESYVRIRLQHSFVVVFCNGILWFIALENTTSSYSPRRKMTLPHYFRCSSTDKSTTRLRCITQKDMSRRKFSDNDLRKLIVKLVSCSLSSANSAEMHNNMNFLSITTSSSQLSNADLTQNEVLNIYWDVIYFLK